MDLKDDVFNCVTCEKADASKMRGDKKLSPYCNADCKGFKSVMVKSVSYTDEKMRNALIRISLLCLETEIGNFVNVFEDLEALFDRYSPDL